VAQRRILTPDRRLRVFVSSTLRELSLERVAAQEAISSLHLAPVLFELGARPHAPRDLYAAYVDQCDVFVGVYWQSYGWIVPGGEISGLEDEFNLAQGKPMLLYIKEPAPGRDDRLNELIGRIQEEAGLSYRRFSTDEELGRLVSDDLAVLLTERFHANPDELEERSGLPTRTTSFVGRVDELGAVVQMVVSGDVRLVTLTGPGGIGKTRLAVEAARSLASRFPDGVAYVALDRLADPDLVPSAIAAGVGLTSLGPDQEAVLTRRLRTRRLLLVLDNFEHVLDAAPLVSRLLEASSDLVVVATSREPLRLQGEHEYSVPPLRDPVPLFIDRVSAVRSDVAWDDANLRAANQICRRVDGVPLAVELVAAGTRMLEPRALLANLGSVLDPPAPGRRDAPVRQQTVRATIDWSYNLLSEPERDLFDRLGAFAGSFTIEAARAVADEQGPAVLATLSALVDKSLLLHAASESTTRFRMLGVVAEYAAERLVDHEDVDEARAAFAEYYVEYARAAYAGLRGREQQGWKEVLDLEIENIRRAVAHLIGVHRLDAAADIVWSLRPYWLSGHFIEGRKLVAALLAGSGAEPGQARARLLTVDGILAALLTELTATHRELEEALTWFRARDDLDGQATALVGLGLATAPLDPDRARTLILESAHLFAALGDAWWEAIVLSGLGWLDTGRGDFRDEHLFERAYSLASEIDDQVTTGHAATNLAELHIAAGRLDEGRDLLAVALTAYEAVRFEDALSYALEATARLEWSRGRSEETARLLATADGLRDEIGLPIWGARLTRFRALAASVREALGDERFDSTWADGRAVGFDAALDQARRALHPTGLNNAA
jgi:predicted ATPase